MHYHTTLPRIDRIIIIPRKLEQKKRSLKDLMEICRASKATIRRDLAVLSLYYPIQEEMDGQRILYFIAPSARTVPRPI